MIRIKYFANLKEIAGKSEEKLDAAELSLEKFSELIERSQPKIAELIRQKKIMVSVNQDVAGTDTIIREGDEIALLPPFSGGV